MKQSKKKKKIITCLHVCIYVYIHTCTEHCIRHVYMQVLNDLMACTKGVLRFLRSIDPVGFSTKTWQVNARMYFIYIIAVCLYTYTYTYTHVYIYYILAQQNLPSPYQWWSSEVYKRVCYIYWHLWDFQSDLLGIMRVPVVFRLHCYELNKKIYLIPIYCTYLI